MSEVTTTGNMQEIEKACLCSIAEISAIEHTQAFSIAEIIVTKSCIRNVGGLLVLCFLQKHLNQDTWNEH